MGAVGIKTFEDDDAADWIADFHESPSVSELVNTLKAVSDFSTDEYLEAPEASCAVAAAEVVAAMLGVPSDDFPSELIPWSQKEKLAADSALRGLAQTALVRVRDNSELCECWIDSNDAANWQDRINNLHTRLAPDANV